MKLYGAMASPYVARSVLFGKLKGIDLELASPPGGRPGTPEFKEISPIGKIPALDVDGVIIPESEVICEYLEDAFPEPSAMPADALAKGQSRTISRVVDLYLSPVSSVLARQINPEKRDAAVVEAQTEELKKVWSYVEGYMGDGPFVAGDKPSMGDCSLATHMVMFKILAFANFDGIDDPTESGRLKEWWDAMQANETCKAVLDEQAVAFEQVMAFFRNM